MVLNGTFGNIRKKNGFFLIFGRLVRCEGRREEVEVSPEPNVAGYKTHRVPFYYLDTPSDTLENQIELL